MLSFRRFAPTFLWVTGCETNNSGVTMAGMKMVFRLQGIGFSLPIEDLIEIRENDDGRIDPSTVEPERWILGALPHRGGTILVRDLHSCMGLPKPAEAHDLPVLVLVGSAGAWGARVEEVCGIFAATEFLSHSVPPIISRPLRQPFDCLEIWRGEPLVGCTAERLESAWGEL